MTDDTTAGAEDVAEALREGRPIREHGPYLVLIADERLEFTKRHIAVATPTGDEILEAAGVLDRASHQVLQLLVTGDAEGLRPSETTDLHAGGVERFVVFRT